MKTLLAILAIIAPINLILAQSPYSFKESYDLGDAPQIMISSSDGNIDAVGFEGNKTDIFYIVTKAGRQQNISRQELEKELELNVTQAGNSLSIVVKYKNNYNGLNWKDKPVVSFRLQVPKGAACDLRTSDGNIAMKGLSKDQRVKTSDGNLNIQDIGGKVDGGTSDGNVVVKKVGGGVDVRTSDGNIEIVDVKGDVRASTSDGNIFVGHINGNTTAKTSDGDINFESISGGLSASTSDGNVTGNLDRLNKELSISTSDGNIAVTIPNNLGLDLNIKGESLDVPLTNFSGRSDERIIQGKSNGGGIPVNLSTSGRVRLTYR